MYEESSKEINASLTDICKFDIFELKPLLHNTGFACQDIEFNGFRNCLTLKIAKNNMTN